MIQDMHCGASPLSFIDHPTTKLLCGLGRVALYSGPQFLICEDQVILVAAPQGDEAAKQDLIH